jgi:hypothetical protein
MQSCNFRKRKVHRAMIIGKLWRALKAKINKMAN